MQMSVLWLALVFLAAGSPPVRGEELYDRAGIEAWLRGDIPRGRGFPVSNAFPSGTKIKFCAGAGCKIKIPFEFSEPELRFVAEQMERARREAACVENNSRCERLALQYGVRSMDRIVRERRLSRMSLDEVVRFSINKDNGNEPENFADRLGRGQQLLRDCVDQAANGSSYLVVLATRGLIRHHRVVPPGKINLGPQPHFFTQIAETGGDRRLYRFDLYRSPRTDFEKLPGVELRN